MSQVVGRDLVNHPELALDPKIAYRIMSDGMRHGSFTGKKLSDYIHGTTADYYGARRIINGTDRAELIAGYASKLEAILKGSISGSSGRSARRPV
jgi:putative chitinase